MNKLINKNNWLASVLILFMPIFLVFFLGSQMAYSQVKSQFKNYADIPELTQLSELEAIPAGEVVMLRGKIADVASPLISGDLVIFQERPADGREIRFREKFPLIFPEFELELPDGVLFIQPSFERERMISHELHRVPSGDRELTGFRAGDTVTVQGEWQNSIQSGPALLDVTGITGIDKAELIAEWQSGFNKVSWARNSLAFLTLLSIISLVVQYRGAKQQQNQLDKEELEWHLSKNETERATV